MCVFTAAAQNRLSSSVLAFIKVLDINDNVPGLARDYQPYICEGTQAGEVCIFTPAQVYGWLCSSEFEWNWSIKILWKPQGIKSFSFISTRFLAEILETHNCLCTLIYLCINICCRWSYSLCTPPFHTSGYSAAQCHWRRRPCGRTSLLLLHGPRQEHQSKLHHQR